VDALENVFQSSSKDLGLRLVVDISHNGLQLETHRSEARWVSRHNNCRPIRGFPGIVAGSNDACSCISYGLDGCEDRVTGYDHGVGTLLKNQSKSRKLKKDERDLHSVKIKMRRGTDAVVGRERFQIYDTTLIDEVMDKLSRAGIAGKAAHMRPLMTLKMVR
jgi:RNA-splicing ligase RtcB